MHLSAMCLILRPHSVVVTSIIVIIVIDIITTPTTEVCYDAGNKPSFFILVKYPTHNLGQKSEIIFNFRDEWDCDEDFF
jgi:hypothetical protein